MINNYLAQYDYANGNKYLRLLTSYEGYEADTEDATPEEQAAADQKYFALCGIHFSQLTQQERYAAYIDLVRQYGARTDRSRFVLQKIAKEENRDIIDKESHAYLGNGIEQAEKATHMEENDMGRLKQQIMLPSGEQKWITAGTQADLCQKCFDAGNLLSQSIIYPVRKAAPLFEEYAWHWFDTYHVKRVKGRTSLTAKSALNKHLIAEFRGKRLDEITHDEIQSFFNDRMRYSHSTQKKWFDILRQIFNNATEDGLIIKNVMDSKRYVLSDSKKERQPLSFDELIDILDHLHLLNEKERLYLLLLAFTGVRRGEALALEWKDIDFKNNEIHITKAVHFDDGNTATIGSTKSVSGVRDIPLVDKLAEALKGYKRNGKYIVSGENMLSETMYQRMWDRIGQTIDLHGATAHIFRHTFCTFACYLNGCKIKELQSIMGHSTSEITMDVYTKATKNKCSRAAVEELFSGLWREHKSDSMQDFFIPTKQSVNGTQYGTQQKVV